MLAHTRERLALGEVPTRELLDGLVVLIGGVIICVPGFVGDAVGLLLMIGPVRHFVIRAFGHHLAQRVQRMRRAAGVSLMPAPRPCTTTEPHATTTHFPRGLPTDRFSQATPPKTEVQPAEPGVARWSAYAFRRASSSR